MRKVLCYLAVALSLVLFVGCDVDDMSSLDEISKPYVGEFTLETLRFGEKDLSDGFESCRLTLRADGAFSINLVEEDGRENSYSGTYRFDRDVGAVTFSLPVGMKEISRTYRYEEGAIVVCENVGGRLLFARFVP